MTTDSAVVVPIPNHRLGWEVVAYHTAAIAITLSVGLYQKCFFFLQKMLLALLVKFPKNAQNLQRFSEKCLSHFLSRLKIRSNKQMIKDQDTGMGGGGACYPISGKGKRTRPYYTSNIKESEHTTTTTTLPALFSRT